MYFLPFLLPIITDIKSLSIVSKGSIVYTHATESTAVCLYLSGRQGIYFLFGDLNEVHIVL